MPLSCEQTYLGQTSTYDIPLLPGETAAQGLGRKRAAAEADGWVITVQGPRTTAVKTYPGGATKTRVFRVV